MSKKDFKGAMLRDVKASMSLINEHIGNISREIETIKKKQMNYKLKTKSEIKNTID